jgi:transketolase
MLDLFELESKGRAARTLALKLHYLARSGHVGSSLSCIELLSFVQFCAMKDGDDVILSKGHAATALYAVLAVAGAISAEELCNTYYRDGTLFPAHPPPRKIPGVFFGTGSLGHGPGLATGISLAHKLAGRHHRVYCIISDGELNEGSVWEAFMFSSHHRLHNLFFLIDRNNLQGFGRTEDVLALEPLAQKLESFGLLFAEADGHCFRALSEEYGRLETRCIESGRPGVLVGHTVKGLGLGAQADTVGCHYLPMTEEVYQRALSELTTDYPNLRTSGKSDA